MLVEAERGQLGRWLGGAEQQFYKRHYHDESEHVEHHCQHVEQQVGGDVPGVELQVSEYAEDGHYFKK